MGYGKMLIEHSFQAAIQLGYDTIVIFGSPANYISRGFKSCKKYNVCRTTLYKILKSGDLHE